jgi:hypothetical protein
MARAWILVALASTAGCLGYAYPVDSRPLVTVDDVVKMREAGVDEATLLWRVRGSRLPAPVTADEIVRMKNAQVPDPVIKALAEAVVVEPGYYYRSYAPYDVDYYWATPYPYSWYWRYGAPYYSTYYYHGHGVGRYYRRP